MIVLDIFKMRTFPSLTISLNSHNWGVKNNFIDHKIVEYSTREFIIIFNTDKLRRFNPEEKLEFWFSLCRFQVIFGVKRIKTAVSFIVAIVKMEILKSLKFMLKTVGYLFIYSDSLLYKGYGYFCCFYLNFSLLPAVSVNFSFIRT